MKKVDLMESWVFLVSVSVLRFRSNNLSCLSEVLSRFLASAIHLALDVIRGNRDFAFGNYLNAINVDLNLTTGWSSSNIGTIFAIPILRQSSKTKVTACSIAQLVIYF